jgi:hypothetical protein
VKASSISITPTSDGTTPVYLNTLTVGDPAQADASIAEGLVGSVACALTADPATGVYGIRDVKTDAAGKVCFYLPTTVGDEPVVLATGTTPYGNIYTRDNTNTGSSILKQAATRIITIGATNTPYTFGDGTYGYGSDDIMALVVKVSNTGSSATGALTVSGSDGGSFFMLSLATLSSIPAGSTGGFVIRPKTGLPAGTYTAEVTVTDGSVTALFDVSFTVNKKGITVTGGAATTKPCDGTTAATVTGLGFTGLESGDNLTDGTDYTVSASFADASAGAGKTVTATVTLSSTATANNYSLTNGTNYLLTGDITPVIPTLASLGFDLTAVTYSGSSKPLAVTAATDVNGLGAVTVYYTGSTTVPTAAGTYAVTADLAAGTIYTAVTGLTLGSYRINPAEPTVAELDFDFSPVIVNGRPQSPTITAAPGIAGLGAVTVYYSGSTRPPDEPGTYTVTADIAGGANYNGVTGLQLGTFTIFPYPDFSISREVTLLPVGGMTGHPLPGLYSILSGTHFTFTLTPDAPLPDDATLTVTTGRALTDGIPDAGVTRNEDGSYTVVVYAVRQNITISVASAVGNERVAAPGLTVYTLPGAVAIANSSPEAATVRIYTFSGLIVRNATADPGTTTHLRLDPGFYVVAAGNVRRKIVIND